VKKCRITRRVKLIAICVIYNTLAEQEVVYWGSLNVLVRKAALSGKIALEMRVADENKRKEKNDKSPESFCSCSCYYRLSSMDVNPRRDRIDLVNLDARV
jgi:hypothetical protein